VQPHLQHARSSYCDGLGIECPSWTIASASIWQRPLVTAWFKFPSKEEVDELHEIWNAAKARNHLTAGNKATEVA